MVFSGTLLEHQWYYQWFPVEISGKICLYYQWLVEYQWYTSGLSAVLPVVSSGTSMVYQWTVVKFGSITSDITMEIIGITCTTVLPLKSTVLPVVINVPPNFTADFHCYTTGNSRDISMGMLVKFGGKTSVIQVVSSGIHWNISGNTSSIPVEISIKIWNYYQWYTGIPVVFTPQISW